jgi:hypothetical protein
MKRAPYPIGTLVTQTGYAGTFTVVGEWRGYPILEDERGITHHAPMSELKEENKMQVGSKVRTIISEPHQGDVMTSSEDTGSEGHIRVQYAHRIIKVTR